MKQTFIILSLFFGIAIKGYSQSTPPLDFFAGKWELIVFGTPDGDKKMIATFTRIDGKMTGELTDPVDTLKEKNPMTSIEEEATKINIFFSASGYDLNVPLEKIDDDNLKGMLMSMFEVKAKRIK